MPPRRRDRRSHRGCSRRRRLSCVGSYRRVYRTNDRLLLSPAMRIRRLGWAGLEIEAEGAVAVVDLFEDVGWMAEYVGAARGPLPPPEAAGGVDVALVTHLHSDHA